MESTLRPHRGGIVLTFGVLGLVPALAIIPFGIPAWVLAARDLRGMSNGRIDPAGRTITQAALICGIVGTIVWVVGIAGIFLNVVRPA